MLEEAVHRGRGELGGHPEGRQCAIEISLLELGPAHDVVGIGKPRVVLDDGGQRLGGIVGLPTFQLRAGHAEACPGEGFGGHNCLVQCLCFGQSTGAQHQFGTDACSIEPVVLAGVEMVFAQGGGGFEVFIFDGGEDALECLFAAARLLDAGFQAHGRVGLDHVGVQGRFGSFRHFGVGGVGGHHHEDRIERQQLVAPEVVQQILSRDGFVFEVVFTDHHIER